MTIAHPATRRNRLDRFCLATGAKRSVVKMDNMVSHLYVVLTQYCWTECAAVLFHSFHSWFYKLVCSSAQILMRHFIFSLHQANLWLTLLFCCCPTVQYMTSMCEAVTYECKKSPVQACALASFTVTVNFCEEICFRITQIQTQYWRLCEFSSMYMCMWVEAMALLGKDTVLTTAGK